MNELQCLIIPLILKARVGGPLLGIGTNCSWVGGSTVPDLSGEKNKPWFKQMQEAFSVLECTGTFWGANSIARLAFRTTKKALLSSCRMVSNSFPTPLTLSREYDREYDTYTFARSILSRYPQKYLKLSSLCFHGILWTSLLVMTAWLWLFLCQSPPAGLLDPTCKEAIIHTCMRIDLYKWLFKESLKPQGIALN